eukprot:TRINITY_DN1423_c0_g1_i2.p1 TRINITY_DN1423_c0_g1~~TRINITY_DN1423_c0_g1_i2.p1  ORF type:complete len:200 (-),score=21.54 TRINITY_DN1423_c0_g1_i2:1125-1724(-)
MYWFDSPSAQLEGVKPYLGTEPDLLIARVPSPRSIAKPKWTPADWVFPTVWIPLKLMQVLGARIIWLQTGRDPLATPIVLYCLHAALGDNWNTAFFREQYITGGEAEGNFKHEVQKRSHVYRLHAGGTETFSATSIHNWYSAQPAATACALAPRLVCYVWYRRCCSYSAASAHALVCYVWYHQLLPKFSCGVVVRCACP